MIDGIHRLTAYAVVALVAISATWSVLNLITGRDGGPRYTAAAAAAVSAVVIAAVAGGLLFLTGSRPSDGLHFLYAALAAAVVPIARGYLLGGGRRDRIVMVVAFGLLAAFVYRLFATG